MSHFKSFRRKHLQVNETILFSIPAFFLGVVIITNMRLAIYDAGGLLSGGEYLSEYPYTDILEIRQQKNPAFIEVILKNAPAFQIQLRGSEEEVTKLIDIARNQIQLTTPNA